MYYKCSIPGCIAPRQDFVPDDIRLKNWLNSLESDSLRSKRLSELSKLRLCSKHFEVRVVNLSSISLLNKANPKRDVIPEDSTKSVQDGSMQHRNVNLPVRVYRDEKDSNKSLQDDSIKHRNVNQQLVQVNQDKREIIPEESIKSVQDHSIQHQNENLQPVQLYQDDMCRICLRSEISMVEEVDPALIEFLEELLYYDITEDNIGMCKVCEHQLRRFYNFRQRCRRAHIVLKNTNKESFDQEKQQLPQLSLGICNAKANQILIDILEPESNNENSFENHGSSDPTDLSFMLKPINQPMFLKINENQKENVNINADETYWDNDELSIAEVEVNDINSKQPVQMKIQDTLIHRITGKDTKNLQILGKDAQSQFVGQNTKYLQIGGKDNKVLQIVGQDAKYLQIVGNDIKSLRIVGKDAENLEKSKAKKKMQKVGKGIIKKRPIGRRSKLTRFKDRVAELIDEGEFSDIEELDFKMSKEFFLNIVEKFPQSVLARSCRILKRNTGVPLIRSFLEKLLKTYNPIYNEVFDIKYLHTHEEKVAEFNSRQYSKEYIEAKNKCELCFRIFDAQGVLEFHQKWHDPNSQYSCKICPMRFKTLPSKNRHQIENHLGVYHCKLCNYLTHKVDNMREHYFSHKGITFDCDTCGRKFRYNSSLANHVRNKHSKQRNCAHCGEYFKSLQRYFAHFASNHADVDEATLPPPQFKCEKCCLFFYNTEALLKHEKRHRELTGDECVDVHPCFFCKKRFDSLQELRQHKLTAQHSKSEKTLSETRTCTLCYEEIDTSKPRAMYNHFKSVHPAAPFIAGRSLLCEQCGQAFAHMFEYKAHIGAHNGELPFECSECGKRFSLRSVAATHVKQHAKVKRKRNAESMEDKKVWQCHLCYKVVAHYANLKRHMLVHTGEKPYECSICMKRFTQSNSMKLHMLTVHEGQKAPYRYRGVKRGNVIHKGGKVGLDNHSDRIDIKNEEIENSREQSAELGQHTPDYAEISFDDEYMKEEIVYDSG